jgi:integrase/recombinase XerD
MQQQRGKDDKEKEIMDEPPKMMVFMFGEQAGVAQRSGSARLLAWCQAFEEFLKQKQARVGPRGNEEFLKTWKDFLRFVKKPAWEVEAADVQRFVDQLVEKGLKANTTNHKLANISVFYKWCNSRGVDAACGENFNPAASIKRRKVFYYSTAKTLTREEIEALLETLLAEGSILSLRDYTLLLAHLLMGNPSRRLFKMQWKDLQRSGLEKSEEVTNSEDDWLDSERMVVHPEVKKAALVYLEAAGRLEGILPDDYIFAPLANPLKEQGSGKAEDWVASRPVGRIGALVALRRFGRMAGIQGNRLDYTTLRHTAAKLYLEAGNDPAAIREFLGLKNERRFRDQMNFLKEQLEQEEKEKVERRESLWTPPRKPHHIAPYEGMKHGMYMQRQPPEQVLEVMAEGSKGLEEEIAGMRTLINHMLGWVEEAAPGRQQADLGMAVSEAATRLSEMMSVEKQLGERRRSKEEDEDLERLLRLADAEGGEGEERLERWRRVVMGLKEEIAGVRLVMRRALGKALEMEGLKDRVRMVEVYGQVGIRLTRLLKAEEILAPDLWAEFLEAADEAIRELSQDLS